MTVNDIISRALRLLNVKATGQTISSAEAGDAISVLNQMIGSWSNEELLVYNIRTDRFDCTVSKQDYTIGLAGEWDTDRPIRIDSLTIRPTGGGDYPVKQINSTEFNNVYLKSLESPLPAWFRYEPQYPLGVISLYPIPSTAMTAAVNHWTHLGEFDSAADDINLPIGYEAALSYGLAYEMALEYGKNPALFEKQMNDAKARLKAVNTEERTLVVDNALLNIGGNRSRRYDIGTDSYI